MFAPNEQAMTEANAMIEELLTEEKQPVLEFGGVYSAKIVEIKDNGVLVTLYENMSPVLIHNNQLDKRKVLIYPYIIYMFFFLNPS